MRVGYKNPSLGISACHHSESIVVPNGDPRDRFFNSSSLIIYSYMLRLYSQYILRPVLEIGFIRVHRYCHVKFVIMVAIACRDKVFNFQ